MRIRYLRRKVRCMVKHGTHGCPHIERHTRRPGLTRAERKQAKADAGHRHRRTAHS